MASSSLALAFSRLPPRHTADTNTPAHHTHTAQRRRGIAAHRLAPPRRTQLALRSSAEGLSTGDFEEEEYGAMAMAPYITQFEEGGQVIEEYEDPEEVAEAVCESVMAAATVAVETRGFFTLAIPGGSVAKALAGLANVEEDLPWDKTHLFFVNERLEGKNLKLAKTVFLDAVGIPESQVYHLQGGDATVEEEAKAYEKALFDLPSEVMPRSSNGLPRFDLILLGAGADGHIGSIYPGSKELSDESACILGVANPEKMSISFSLPLINAAEQIVIAATGGEKAKMVKAVLNDSDKTLPVGKVECKEDCIVTWLLDEAAAEFVAVTD